MDEVVDILVTTYNTNEKYLKKQPGIIDANVNLVLAQALITYEDNLTLSFAIFKS